jgi:HEPN domain-containing protein
LPNHNQEHDLNSEDDDMDFVYSFDMSNEITYFKRMPEEVQSSAECNAVDVIYESFVVPGDQDYLMSRLLAQKGLPRGFYWAAAQAIEKYLKAFLLMNDESVKEFKAHPIKKLFEVASKIDTSLININITPHHSIQVESSYSSFLEKYTIQQFLDELEKHGSANNRYNAFGVEYNTGHLCAMDSLSFQLRRKIGVLPINRSLKKLSPDLIQIFEKNNPWFCTEENLPLSKIPSEDFPIQSSSSVTKLEILIKHNGNPAYNIALQWLNAKMKLPKEISEQLT